MKCLAYVSLMALFVNKILSFSRFLKEPSDDSQPEGELTYFTCVVRRLEDTEYVSWLQNGLKISNNFDIIIQNNERYSIVFDPNSRAYNLQIEKTQRTDTGIYTCIIYNDNDRIVAESRTSNFTVLQIPREQYPICLPIKASYIIGQSIVVSCTSEQTEPPVHLKWKRDNVEILSTFIKETIDNIHKVSYSLIAKESDNRVMFICELTTPANPSIRRNCSSGPINIVYAPRVHIQQTSDSVLGKEVIFICYGDANPQEVVFKWSFQPPIDENMYLLENDRVLRIKKTTSSFNGTKVVCQVTNSVGNGSGTLNINIKSANTKGSKDVIEETKTGSKVQSKEIKTNSDQQVLWTPSPKNKTDISISLIIAIAVACIVVILGLAMIPVGYMKYTRRLPTDTISRGRPVSIPDVYFEPRDHVDPMLPQLGLSAPWMRTVGVQVPGECEYDVTYNTQVMPHSRQVYYSQRMYPMASL